MGPEPDARSDYVQRAPVIEVMTTCEGDEKEMSVKAEEAVIESVENAPTRGYG
jgi:hypothetical protein